MNEFFSAENLAQLPQQLYTWVLANVLTVENAIQLGIAAFAFGAALIIARRLKPWFGGFRVPATLTRVQAAITPLVLPLVWLLIQWLCIAAMASTDLSSRLLILTTIASLLTAWVLIRIVSQLVKNQFWSTTIAWTAWTIAALNILNVLDRITAALESQSFDIGTNDPISLLDVVKSTLALAVLLSLAIYFSGLLEARIRTVRTLSPSVQVLFIKALKITLIGVAIIFSINTLGIDLTALAVFGGALGLGVGFGLQKIVSNLISGVILLLDKSIKPGDVIAVSGTYGWVTALGGRYVSVVTRDGVEHLIPNETLISERVENWTHTHSKTRLKVDVGVHYNSDIHHVIEICLEAASEIERVLEDPAPNCLLIEFGDNSVNLQVRFWIGDAQNGVQNVKSAVMLRIWDKFKEHKIEIPYPQRDLHLRSGPVSIDVTGSANHLSGAGS